MTEGEVHLWHVDPRIDDPPRWRASELLLSREERCRLESLRIPRVRREYLVTRALVRTVLSKHGNLPPASWRFRTNEHGRPEIDPPCRLRFSVSHCDRLVVCAVATGREIGVDVESTSRGEAILDLAPHVFSSAERDDLARVPELARRREYAAALWTLKESYVKARGTGLATPLQSFGFAILGGDPVLRPPEDDSASRWSSRSLHLGESVLAVTVETDGTPWSLALHADPLICV